MIILKISEEDLNAAWERIEAGHPWGLMPLGTSHSEYLLKAIQLGLVSKDVALELYMAAIGIGTTDP